MRTWNRCLTVFSRGGEGQRGSRFYRGWFTTARDTARHFMFARVQGVYFNKNVFRDGVSRGGFSLRLLEVLLRIGTCSLSEIHGFDESFSCVWVSGWMYRWKKFSQGWNDMEEGGGEGKEFRCKRWCCLRSIERDERVISNGEGD